MPEGFRERMAEANILSYRVLYFEQEPETSALCCSMPTQPWPWPLSAATTCRPCAAGGKGRADPRGTAARTRRIVKPQDSVGRASAIGWSPSEALLLRGAVA